MSQTLDYAVEVVGEAPPPKIPWKVVAAAGTSVACVGAIVWAAFRL